MAGHVITLYRGASKEPVDYNDGERPYRVKQEFSPNHRYDPLFLLIVESSWLSQAAKPSGELRIKNKNMFSGIIEEFATVVAIKHDRENIDFTLTCSFVGELSIDQSVAHNGVCLTVVSIDGDRYTVTAMKETLDRSNLGLLSVGDKVNVERSMLMNGRLDGHIVQGHVDETAKCIGMEDADGSTYFTFEYAENREMAKKGYFTVDKGSVTVNGVSLTVCNPTSNTFQVAIIPYTFEHTNFCDIRVGSVVNLEFDILGKYIARLQQL
jgi:riboflavin synthase